jgi:6-pyruvoyltetrahydropterin/6-carboxytetrahydropterin synthase
LAVTVIGEAVIDKGNPKLGMVIDFGDLKRIVKDTVVDIFDHALVINSETSAEDLERSNEMFEKVLRVDFQPTSENLVVYFAEKISAKLPVGLVLHNLKLRETATSFAEWYATDNYK